MIRRSKLRIRLNKVEVVEEVEKVEGGYREFTLHSLKHELTPIVSPLCFA